MPSNLSIRRKLIILTALFVGMTGTLAAFYASRLAYQSAEEDMRAEGVAFAHLYQHVLVDPFRLGEDYQIYELISAPFKSKKKHGDSPTDRNSARNYLENIALLDDSGNVLATSDPQRIPLTSAYANAAPEFASIATQLGSLKESALPLLLEPGQAGHFFVLAPLGENGVKYATLVMEYSSEELLAATVSQVKQLIMAIVLITLLMMALAWIAADRFTQPLLRLAGSMRQLAVRHGFRISYEEYGRRDEVIQLKKIFSDLEQALDHAKGERDHFRQQEKMALAGLENSAQGIIIADARFGIVMANEAVSRLTGYPDSEVAGMQLMQLCMGNGEHDFAHAMRHEILQTGAWEGEYPGLRRNGTHYTAWLSVTSMQDEHAGSGAYVCILSDISERKAAEEKIRHQAEHDVLTGLPNRILLQDRLEQAIARAARDHEQLAVMFLDLDHFKHVNDLLGHHVGDVLLRMVSQRLLNSVRVSDTVSRMGGDEFVLMLAPVGGETEVQLVADKLIHAISMPYRLEDGSEIDTSASIGISFYPADGDTSDILIKSADEAMYRAKENGRNNYQMFTPDMHGEVFKRASIENQLRQAIRQQQFILHYQPQLELASGRITGLEALIRWQHPERGLVFPGEFIEIAEESGLIAEIGAWVIEETCRQLRAWLDAGVPAPMVAVNISFRQFHRHDLQAALEAALQRYRLAGNHLEIELTESVMLSDPEQVLEVLQKLRAQGIRISVDDFGTGYSSLSYLRQLNIDALKIDRSFVLDMDHPHGLAMVKVIHDVASALGLRTIAEGVETAAQLEALSKIGCDEIQGYYFSKPLPADEVAVVLTQHARQQQERI